jgi:chromosomal replication initiator protein
MTDLDYEGIWKETLVQLRNDLGEEVFSGWFSDFKYLRTEENNVIVGIPSAFHRDKVKSHYQNALNSKIKEISGKDIVINYEITGKNSKKDAASSSAADEIQEKTGESAASST